MKHIFISILYISAILLPATLAAEERFSNTAEEMVRDLSDSRLGKPKSAFGNMGASREFTRVDVATYNDEGEQAAIAIEVGPGIPNTNLKVEFDFDRYEIRKNSYRLLDELGKAMNHRQLVTKQFIIAGHTDDVGDARYNTRLSLQRARAVKDYLVRVHGIKQARLVVVGAGENQPLVRNNSNANRQKNRRVEIIIKF